MTQDDLSSRPKSPTSRLAVTATEPRSRERVESRRLARPELAEKSRESSPEDIAKIIGRRRRLRMLCFVILEAVAIGLMITSAVAGISSRFAAESLTPIFRVLPISAAIVAVILPIIFFGDPKRRNRSRRNKKR